VSTCPDRPSTLTEGESFFRKPKSGLCGGDEVVCPGSVELRDDLVQGEQASLVPHGSSALLLGLTPPSLPAQGQIFTAKLKRGERAGVAVAHWWRGLADDYRQHKPLACRIAAKIQG
jgi:hypothetical protein